MRSPKQRQVDTDGPIFKYWVTSHSFVTVSLSLFQIVHWRRSNYQAIVNSGNTRYCAEKFSACALKGTWQEITWRGRGSRYYFSSWTSNAWNKQPERSFCYVSSTLTKRTPGGNGMMSPVISDITEHFWSASCLQNDITICPHPLWSFWVHFPASAFRKDAATTTMQEENWLEWPHCSRRSLIL